MILPKWLGAVCAWYKCMCLFYRIGTLEVSLVKSMGTWFWKLCPSAFVLLQATRATLARFIYVCKSFDYCMCNDWQLDMWTDSNWKTLNLKWHARSIWAVHYQWWPIPLRMSSFDTAVIIKCWPCIWNTNPLAWWNLSSRRGYSCTIICLQRREVEVYKLHDNTWILLPQFFSPFRNIPSNSFYRIFAFAWKCWYLLTSKRCLFSLSLFCTVTETAW